MVATDKLKTVANGPIAVRLALHDGHVFWDTPNCKHLARCGTGDVTQVLYETPELDLDNDDATDNAYEQCGRISVSGQMTKTVL